MLTLFTGVPGTGKTAAGVALVLELVKPDAHGVKRPLYVIEIPEENVPPIDLKVEHTLIGPDDAHRWQEVVPDGCVVYMPEAQRLWTNRSAGSKVPPGVEAIGQHRHRGIDIVLDTQHPKMLDDRARLRVGRHVHLRDLGVFGRHWYEWPEVGDPAQWRGAPVKMKYRLPKHVFGLYKSATKHIKPKRSFPPSLIVFVVALLIALVLFGRLAWRVMQENEPEAPAAVEAPLKRPAVATGFRASSGGQVITGTTMTVAMMPRLQHDPGSAPAYDHLRVVKAMPRIVGGFCREGKCRCYTQQGTDPGVANDVCAAWVARPPFNPYRADYVAGAAAGVESGEGGEVSKSLMTSAR